MVREKVAVSLVRNINSSIILDYLIHNPDATIPEISGVTGLSLPTVTRTINKALKIQLVQSTHLKSEERGRKAQCYCFNGNYCRSILIYLDSSTAFLKVVRLNGQEDSYEEIPIDADNILSQLHKMIQDKISQYNNIQNICLIFSAHITNGTVLGSKVFPKLNGRNLKEDLEVVYRVNVFVMDSIKALSFSGYEFLPDYKEKSALFLVFNQNEEYGAAVSIRGVTFPGMHGVFGELSMLAISPAADEYERIKMYIQNAIAVLDPECIILYGDSLSELKKIIAELSSDVIYDYALPEITYRDDILHDRFAAMRRVVFDMTLSSIELKNADQDPMQKWYSKL